MLHCSCRMFERGKEQQSNQCLFTSPHCHVMAVCCATCSLLDEKILEYKGVDARNQQNLISAKSLLEHVGDAEAHLQTVMNSYKGTTRLVFMARSGVEVLRRELSSTHSAIRSDAQCVFFCKDSPASFPACCHQLNDKARSSLSSTLTSLVTMRSSRTKRK